jgi:fructose-specific phosphotransferase system IIC component
VPMLPLFTTAPAGVDYSQTITDPIGITDATAYGGPVNYTVTVTDNIGLVDSDLTATITTIMPPPIVLNSAALVRAHYW